MIEEALVELLKENTDIEQLVQGRVYHQYLPQDVTPEYPAIVYHVISRPHVKDLSGNAKLYSPRYQLDIYSLASRDIRTIARALVKMEGKLTVADPSSETTPLWIWHEDESDDLNEPQFMEEKGVRVASVDVTIWYRE